jgi:hypothetical protein
MRRGFDAVSQGICGCVFINPGKLAHVGPTADVRALLRGPREEDEAASN